jgi:tRNA nucleotidyltransferase (CCA-adding enzyme)
MKLPEYVTFCLDTLEGAGFAAYAVGGCVRDHLLGLQPHDFDLCTAARPEQIRACFPHHEQVLAGMKHGTVGIIFPEAVVEITSFRAEGTYSDCRHPDWVEFVDHIEGDLARRDFTVNAMAWSPVRGLADPFGGKKDLENRVLRAVGDPHRRFQEDALRILRGARFAARYGLRVHEKTLDGMLHLAPLMDGLAKERIFSELCKLLLWAEAEDLLRFAPIITQVIPELRPTVGLDQHSVHHSYDLYTHIAHVTAAVPRELPLRWAALLHDVGKPAVFTLDEEGHGHFYGHAPIGGEMAEEILNRLKAPADLCRTVKTLVELHMVRFEIQRKPLRRWLSRLGKETLMKLIALQEGDMGSKGTGKGNDGTYFSDLRCLLEELDQENSCLSLKDLAVNGKDLLELGYRPGKELGKCLQDLLDQVIDETLPNDSGVLLAEAEKKLSLPTKQ